MAYLSGVLSDESRVLPDSGEGGGEEATAAAIKKN